MKPVVRFDSNHSVESEKNAEVTFVDALVKENTKVALGATNYSKNSYEPNIKLF